MLDAALWGFIAASSLLIGALVAFRVPISDEAQGLILAFGSGVLMSAVAYELVSDSLGDAPRAGLYGLALGAGAVTFFLGSVWLARGERDGDGDSDDGTEGAGGHLASHRGSRQQGKAIVLGSVLDGIPESVVLGLSLLSGPVSVPVLAAVFISNLPESIGASTDLKRAGTPPRAILRMWLLVALASAAAAAIGYAVLRGADPSLVVMVQLYAGGAILAMLAESMIPEAYQKGGRAVGLATVFGFAVAATLSAVS